VSDQFDKNLREHLHHEAEEIREFPRRLRGRIREGITPRARTRMAPQLALAGALVLVAFAVLVVRNPQVIIKDVPSAIKQILQPSPSPTPQPFICSDRSGGTTGVSAQLTGIRVAHHAESPGFDRIVFDFSGGIPSYDLTRQESSTFVKDASGQSVALDGNAGIKLVFRDADVQGAPDDQKPNLAAVREIAQLGNFERVLTYGVGLSSSGCVRVLELTGPARLVVDVMTSPAASPAPTPLPTVPSATDNAPFTCQDLAGGSSPGPAMRLTAVRVAHQPAGYDRIVFEFAPPPGVSPFIPAYTVQRQASSKFVKDPSGQDVTLRGSSGLRIVMHGASGVDSYSGPTDLTPGLPVLQEVERLGDFEAVLSWGAGLNRPSCIRTLELSNPTRLVIDIQTP
jgi:hypothetical protein